MNVLVALSGESKPEDGVQFWTEHCTCTVCGHEWTTFTWMWLGSGYRLSAEVCPQCAEREETAAS